MAHVLSKFKIQHDEFVAKIGVEYEGFRMRNIERKTNDNSTAPTTSTLLEYLNKGRIITFAIRDMVSIHPEFLREYCHFDPDSAIFRIKERKRTLCLKFPTGKKCWECGIRQSKIAKIQTCTDCRKGKYCSITCQASNWDDHKDFCKKLLELNREITSILHTNDVVQNMVLLFEVRPSGNALTPLGFGNNFGKRDLDSDTIEIIEKTGYEICRSIARLFNDLNMLSS